MGTCDIRLGAASLPVAHVFGQWVRIANLFHFWIRILIALVMLVPLSHQSALSSSMIGTVGPPARSPCDSSQDSSPTTEETTDS